MPNLLKRISTKYIVVHCSDTYPSQDIGVKEIRDWHVNDNGWEDIGYHFVIRRNGKREIGRDVDKIGSHVKGYNTDSIGICMVGGKGNSNFTQSQWDELATLVKTLKIKYPNAEVVGHCNLNPYKTCPNFDVLKWYKQIKE